MAGGLGFEPRLAESESAVLPLNYPPLLPRINYIAYYVLDKQIWEAVVF